MRLWFRSTKAINYDCCCLSVAIRRAELVSGWRHSLAPFWDHFFILRHEMINNLAMVLVAILRRTESCRNKGRHSHKHISQHYIKQNYTSYISSLSSDSSDKQLLLNTVTWQRASSVPLLSPITHENMYCVVSNPITHLCRMSIKLECYSCGVNQ